MTKASLDAILNGTFKKLYLVILISVKKCNGFLYINPTVINNNNINVINLV